MGPSHAGLSAHPSRAKTLIYYAGAYLLTNRSNASSETIRRAQAATPVPLRCRPAIAGSWGTDVLAGITLAAVAIPECMGYTKIAGTPVVTGLYTILLPLVAFALLGSSRSLVVGADSATAAILFAGLTGVATPFTDHWLALTSAAALLTAAVLMAAALLRLGFLADFLSRTVLVGFLSGVGVSLMLGQLPEMLGVTVRSGAAGSLLAQFSHANLATGSLAAGTLVMIVVVERLAPRVPAALLGLGVATGVTWIFRLDQRGVAVVGSVRAGLPAFRMPPVSAQDLVALMPTVASIFLVVVAQSAATSRSFAQKHGDRLEENRDLFALAAANALAGFSSTFVVNGSPTKTAIVDQAGGRSQRAQLTTAGLVLVFILFATSVIAWLPSAALSALVFLIGINLIDVESLQQIFRFRRVSFAVALGTLLAVVVVGVERGMFIAIGLSLIDHLRQEYRPKDVVLLAAAGGLRPMRANPPIETEPGLIVYRFEAPLFFANADHFTARVQDLVLRAPHPPQWFVFDLVSMDDIDYTGGLALITKIKQLRAEGIVVGLANIDDVATDLMRIGVMHHVAAGHVFEAVSSAVEAFRLAAGS